MYGSNPNIMGVFAYEMDYNKKINNPIAFLNRTTIQKHEQDRSVQDRTQFLREYALKNDLPFVVFGD